MSFTDLLFHHNLYASTVWKLIAQNLIILKCSIGHANASTYRSSCLAFLEAALDIFLAKSTMVEIFAILDMRTL
jgi:hypothetical protein